MRTEKDVIGEVSIDDEMVIPDNPSIGYVEGEGIGPEITKSMIDVVNSALELAYSGGKSIEWKKILIGNEAYEKYGKYIPDESIEEIKKSVITMKSTLNMLPDKDDINILLRKKLGLYTNLRKVKYFPGIPVIIKTFENLNITVIRDSLNVEISLNYSSDNTQELIKFLSENYDININPDSTIRMTAQSRYRVRKIAKKAAEYYIKNRMNKITIVYNNLNYEFSDWCMDEFKKYQGKINFETIEVQDFIKNLLPKPESYDMVILDSSLSRPILSFLLYVVNVEYGGSFGDNIALFEAIQSSSPDDAGYDVADPLSFIMSGAMMLRYIGWDHAADIIENAINQSFIDNKVPRDFAERENVTPVKCSEFSQEIIKRMRA